jgi:hypothetical protein
MNEVLTPIHIVPYSPIAAVFSNATTAVGNGTVYTVTANNI